MENKANYPATVKAAGASLMSCFRHLEKPIKTKENKRKHFFSVVMFIVMCFCFYMFLLVLFCFFRRRKQLEGLFRGYRFRRLHRRKACCLKRLSLLRCRQARGSSQCLSRKSSLRDCRQHRPCNLPPCC